MKLRIAAASALMTGILAFAGIAQADALSVSCSGVASASSITWTANSSGGVSPVAFLWGNGATSASITENHTPGTYSMTIQGMDASSTVATSSCSASIAAPALPQITSFTATPGSILPGQSAVLAWTVSNASSTSLDQGIGAVSSSSLTVSPTVTTSYHLSAVNPNGTTTSSVTVTVGTTTSSGSGSVADKIKALLQQIAALQQQVAQLIAARFGGTLDNPGFIPPGQIGKIACIELGRNLHQGDRGDDVRKLQDLLRSDSDSDFTASSTGVFGPLTARAMAHFQMKNGIASSTDGSVGPLTRGFFSRSCGKGLLKQTMEKEHGHSWKNGSSTDATSSTDVNEHGNSDHENNSHGNDGNDN